MNASPNQEPEYDSFIFVHNDDERACHYRPYWVGNVRDGHWEFDYWYRQDDTWRYCGRDHN